MATSSDDPITPDEATPPPPTAPTSPDLTDDEPAELVEATPVRFAVYDNTLLRFVSGVVETYDEAAELASLSPESHDVEVREV